MLIFAEGLFGGNRLRRCSNASRLHWPYLFLLSNSYARLELDYERIISTAYCGFDPLPTEVELESATHEYSQCGLLFVYTSPSGAKWGQWYVPFPSAFPRYKTQADRKSPAPSAKEFMAWAGGHVNDCSTTAYTSGKTHENISAKNLPLDVEVEVEVEVDKNTMSKPDSRFDLSPFDPPVGVNEIPIRKIWDHYIEQIGKNPAIYTLTATRRKMGVCRFRDALAKVGGDYSKANELMECAIDAMRDSEWHHGKNERHRKYLDWELLFRSTDQFEKWLERADQ